MDVLYIIVGIVLSLIGIWLTIKEIKVFAYGKPGELGSDAKGLVLGVGCIICGIILIMKYI